MNKFNDRVCELNEGFKCIKLVKREFYPKNFTLSEDFVLAFRREYKRLLDEGIEPKKALIKLNKALLFHTK